MTRRSRQALASASSKLRGEGGSRSARSRKGYESDPKRPLYKKSVLKTKSNKGMSANQSLQSKVNSIII